MLQKYKKYFGNNMFAGHLYGAHSLTNSNSFIDIKRLRHMLSKISLSHRKNAANEEPS